MPAPEPQTGDDAERHVRVVCAAIAGDDWVVLRRVLHPYLRFTDAHGRTTRGRLKVMALLREVEVLQAPAEVELRNGQVYRWLMIPTD